MSLEGVISNPVTVKNPGLPRRISGVSYLKEVLYGMLVGLLLGGCSHPTRQVITPGENMQKVFRNAPRLRFGSYPTPTIPTTCLDPNNLGSHGYDFKLSEKNGIVYTCKAGHIDIIHARISADWTAYLATKTYENLMKKSTGFSFRMKVEPTEYFVQIKYPENWENLAEKQVREIAVKLGQYLTFNATTWHEIITWFNFKCIGPLPEFPSAFSWEDSFSNLLGTYIGAQALRDSEHAYDEAVRLALNEELNKLDAQPAYVARDAAESVRGKWFSGSALFFVDMGKKNLDIGFDDGYIMPTLVPSVRGCEGAEPLLYPVPNLDFLGEFGLSVYVEINPKVWEGNKILRVVYPEGSGKRVQPDKDFPVIMNYIKKEAVEKGYDVEP